MGHTRFALIELSVAAGLFFGMLLFLELGRRLGVRQVERRGTGARAGVGVVDSAVYSLLGLLIGFSFSGAAGRFDWRRGLIVQEVNAIGTAWLRIDALPAEPQLVIRDSFRRYLDALLAQYAEAPGSPEELRARAAVVRAENDVWARSLSASIDASGEKARMLLVPAVNEMFDAVQKEHLARQMHPPMVVYVMLGLTALAAAVFAGYGIASGTTRNWMHMIGLAATISIVSFVILELESPRLGWIRVDAADRALVELRETMNAPVAALDRARVGPGALISTKGP
jgi:hypothetical protein